MAEQANGEWRYLAQRFDGNGNLGDFFDLNLPLQSVSISEVLSGHNSLSGTIAPEFARLKSPIDGRPIFDEWGACIWAEAPNGEVFGGILQHSGFSGSEWTLETIGLSGMTIEAPYTEANFWVNVDPIDMFRHIYAWLQGQPGGNLGMDIDPTHSPVRLGGDLVQYVEFDTEGEDPLDAPETVNPSPYDTNERWVTVAVNRLAKNRNGGFKKSVSRAALEKYLANGRADKSIYTSQELKIIRKAIKMLKDAPFPYDAAANNTPSIPGEQPIEWVYDSYKLNWYTDFDLSQNLDDLAAETPFDWHEIHYWSDESDEADLHHHIRVGYPKLGRRITELRFVVGENIEPLPNIERDGTEYANEVLVIGAGEGAAAKHGRAFRPHPGRLRRCVTVSAPELTTDAACVARAEQELAKRSELEDITEIQLIDHPHAPMGSVALGDEILLEGETGWADLSVWVRVLGRTFSPDDGNSMNLTVMRTDRLG